MQIETNSPYEYDEADGPDLSNAILFADSARGVYIPQHFAQAIVRDCVTGVSDDDFAILAAGPDHEDYWQAWSDVMDSATITIPETGREAYLFQDGDLWIVPR